MTKIVRRAVTKIVGLAMTKIVGRAMTGLLTCPYKRQMLIQRISQPWPTVQNLRPFTRLLIPCNCMEL